MSSQQPHGSLARDDREDVELPLWPFQSLRVAPGMLLGTEDFHVMLGNPRAKMRLHQGWLHGSGVVWGLPVTLSDDATLLEVGQGLAVDGWGRELRLEHQECLTLQAWAKAWLEMHPDTTTDSGSTSTCKSGTRHVCVHVVLEADWCLDRLVPALADPCDTTRKHNEASRVVETARLRIVEEAPAQWEPYPRVRALLGLDTDGKHTSDERVVEALRRVRGAPPKRRRLVLLEELRCLAALDVTEVVPPRQEGTPHPGLFSVPPAAAPVVLARLCLDVEADGCVTLCEPIDPCARRALLPTTTLQDLLCAGASGSTEDQPGTEVEGPRLQGRLKWDEDLKGFSFRLTARAAAGSQEHAVEVSSLSAHGHGWAREECRRIRLTKRGKRVRVRLDGPPSYGLVRVVVRGTGTTPLYGASPRAPFAGLLGGAPGGADEGHDAVLTSYFPHLDSSQEKST
ncbi:hypothetical protein [Nocardioides sp. zg-1230]|uniref:hypothetical protein n=1 Tax=Nocardioides sp. zg-1230 TaxID=2736601 RepID=UPI0015544336|nr:hypothetical protein [Nocardioides sp. zg-1230]NPC44595.1 hypothetical protein [Nocardioides sp. zg-1230]